MTKKNQSKKQDLVVTRIIDAPVELVWKAWTDPEFVMRWWGPKDYTSPSCKIDLHEGGKYLFCMRAPKDQGGQDMYNAGVYKKIVTMERLEFTQGMADKDGHSIDPAQVGMPDFPKEMNIEVVFKSKKCDMATNHQALQLAGERWWSNVRLCPGRLAPVNRQAR